jgi:hypothetical protein
VVVIAQWVWAVLTTKTGAAATVGTAVVVNTSGESEQDEIDAQYVEGARNEECEINIFVGHKSKLKAEIEGGGIGPEKCSAFYPMVCWGGNADIG